ncbi:protein TolR [Paralimibaculum aggregatum]|uniref:Protein TolR n=1 Tax=Paralimibaculum aggregatum TaxID=3036245 RepID=A0ABQ6LJA8_9RHOB|nr:ExbD/TolR family protein [Limibaculum sp. NKW23]GMG83344.1 protein TolR [Limibaculum sp. NKW23]
MGAGVGQARGARTRGQGQGLRPMSEINVTPFVDVMLVLLIIFMVAAPLLTVGVAVELPETNAPPLPNAQEEPLTVTVDAGGGFSIQNQPVPVAELLPKLAAIRAAREDDTIYLRADAGIDYGRVSWLIAELNRAGFLKITFVHDQPAGGLPEGEDAG